MQELLLIRHGIAADAEPGQPDAERALTQRGRARTSAIAADLAGLLPGVDWLLTSTLVRARETAAILADALAVTQQDSLAELRPGGDPAAVYRHLAAESGGVGRVALVGHEPQMNALLGLGLTGEPLALARFRKAGIAWLRFDAGIQPGGGELVAFLPPAIAFGARS